MMATQAEEGPEGANYREPRRFAGIALGRKWLATTNRAIILGSAEFAAETHF